MNVKLVLKCYIYKYCIDHMSIMMQCRLEKYAECSCDE